MSKIAVLPDILINKIAAGEVIERPASIVRELIDNSIDAGATKIDVDVLHGGKKFIKVSDNGSGMDREDALLCLERHATSKIRTEEDLHDISSLGFRGEALAAVTSVSKIILTTCIDGAGSGTMVEIGADRKKEVVDTAPLQGTTVEIRDLFYNTPARRKFFKSNPTELSHIIETVMQKAFAYPSISFSLVHNNSELLNTPAVQDLKERFVQLYGEETSREFRKVQRKGRGVGICGFVSAAGFTRAGKSHQYIFVNKRPVKNPTVNHAVYRAYDGSIQRDRHPAYFIFLDVDPEKVDVNVHPAKREVRFEAPDEIHRLVEAAVYEALNPGIRKEPDHIPAPESASPGMTGGFTYITDSPSVGESAPDMYHNRQTDFFASGLTPDIISFIHLGESFFATVTGDGLLIIDQHAAHERILYEQLLKKTSLEAELLFLPLRVELPVRDYLLLIRHKELLCGLGLEVEDFGGNNVIVRTLPKGLSKADMKGLLMDVSAGILEEETSGIKGEAPGDSLLKNIAARLACHKSVRGSEQLAGDELRKMMSDLDRTTEPDRCPHGRPTRILLSLDDLKKMFKRK